MLHEYHDCPEAKAVWTKVAADWLEATGNALDAGSPLLTVTGLRLPAPGGLSAGARARFEALEPAWRLVELHSVTLLKLHQARTRAHMAYHAEPRRRPAKTSTRDVVRAVKLRVLQRVEFEHSKAKHAATFSRDQRPLSRFFTAWVTTGVVASVSGNRPRLRLFSAPRPEALPPPGTLHIRTCGTHVKARGRRGPGSGFSLIAHAIQADGTEALVLTTSGPVPTVATHGTKAPPSAASQHTAQVAQHAAALAGLACAERALANGWNVRTTLGSETTHRSIEHRAARNSTPSLTTLGRLQSRSWLRQLPVVAAGSATSMSASGTTPGRPPGASSTAGGMSEVKRWRGSTST